MAKEGKVSQDGLQVHRSLNTSALLQLLGCSCVTQAAFTTLGHCKSHEGKDQASASLGFSGQGAPVSGRVAAWQAAGHSVTVRLRGLGGDKQG